MRAAGHAGVHRQSQKAITLQLTHEVKHLNNEEVAKYAKRYAAYVGSKTTESLIDSFIFLATKVAGMAVKIKDLEAYQKELRNDYILNKELSNLASNLALKCGRFAAANAVLINTKHIDYSPQQGSAPCPGDVGWNPTQLPLQSHPSRYENSNPLEGFEDFEEVPGSATAE